MGTSVCASRPWVCKQIRESRTRGVQLCTNHILIINLIRFSRVSELHVTMFTNILHCRRTNGRTT